MRVWCIEQQQAALLFCDRPHRPRCGAFCASLHDNNTMRSRWWCNGPLRAMSSCEGLHCWGLLLTHVPPHCWPTLLLLSCLYHGRGGMLAGIGVCLHSAVLANVMANLVCHITCIDSDQVDRATWHQLACPLGCKPIEAAGGA